MAFSNYVGYETASLNEAQMSQLYSENKVDGLELLENQYLIVKDAKDDATIDTFVCKDGRLYGIPYQWLDNDYLGQIKPRNTEQRFVINMLLDPDTKIKVVGGCYGSGKDYLMLAAALQLIEKGKFDKIVFIRPNVTVKGLPDIGALPGTADEKLAWTLAPLYDKVGGEEGVRRLVNDNMLESVPLLFIRGRSFERSIIYVTEGQNMTSDIAKLLIGRIGEGSELWLNADVKQSDRKLFDEDNGVRKMIDRLAGNPLFGYVFMPKTERSKVAELASLLDD